MKIFRHPAFFPIFSLTLFLGAAGGLRAADAVRLREAFPAGYQYHVSTRVELTGSLTLPAEKGKPAPAPLAVTGDSAIDYDERVLTAAADGTVEKTLRVYRRLDMHRNVGAQKQESAVRPTVRRMVVLRRQNVAVPFSPDGPLTWGEIDLVRTDVFTPALAGLLPDGEVKPGDRWTARRTAIQALTDLGHIDEGDVECRLEGVTTLEGRRHARVALAGTVRGVNEDGPNRQRLDGYYFFDLESGHLGYLYLKGVNFLLDKDGKEVGRVEGQFVLTRQAHTAARDLADEALRGVALEPDAENTKLLYDDPTLGVRFLYPRRWRVAGVRGRQLGVDSADGSGLLLTLEPPSRVPTGAQFLAESRNYLQEQKARVLRIDPPRAVQAAPREVEQFGLEVEVMGQRVQMDYYVARQAGGGATLAARLLPGDLANLRKEVEGIARSLTLTRAVEDRPR
ncbi:MAG TPA: hypothetical protein VJ739_14705 [Gemmataceae bacterium]|nr:hypothetical protein [Gemmataceae bacterium]